MILDHVTSGCPFLVTAVTSESCRWRVDVRMYHCLYLTEPMICGFEADRVKTASHNSITDITSQAWRQPSYPRMYALNDQRYHVSRMAPQLTENSSAFRYYVHDFPEASIH